MKIFFIILAIVLIVGIGYYFVSKPATPSIQPDTYSAIPSAPATNTATMPAAAQSSVNTSPAPVTSKNSMKTAVVIQNFAFSPASVTIKTGTTVTWTNDDNVGHTVTSDSGSLMNSPVMVHGQSYSVTFTNHGTFNYHCSVHPMMHGTVVVSG